MNTKLTKNTLRGMIVGSGVLCLAAGPLWAQGGPQASGGDNAARAGVGNPLTNRAQGIPEGEPGDAQPIPQDESDDMQKAYKDYTDKKFSAALPRLLAIEKKSPKVVEAHEMLADIYLRQNQVPQAIPELETVVRLKPKDASFKSNLGVAYLQSGDSVKAAGIFQTLATQYPVSADYSYKYAIALEKGGQHAAAAAAFEKAAPLDPKNGQLPLDAGLLYHQVGSDAKAVPLLKSALTMAPSAGDKFNAYTALAEAAATAKQSDDAIQYTVLASQAKPSDFNTVANLGIMQQNAGKKADAEATYRQAIALKTNDTKSLASIQSNLAMLLTADGKVGEAVPLLVQATQNDPSSVSLQDNLGAAYEKQGKKPEALAAYKQALALNPNSGIAKDGAARLSKP